VNLIWNAISLALRALLRNKTRAVLTVLGILIGVSAVVIVTALAESASDNVGSQIDNFGSNILFINPQPTQQSGARQRTSGRLTEADGKAIAREAVSVSNVAPFLSTMTQVVYSDRNVATMIAGVTLSYFPVRKYKIGRGETWTEADELLRTKVCILGTTVSEKLFGTEEPIGRIIRIGRAPYRVIGILEERGTSTFGDDQDDRILMPIGSFRARVMHTSPGRVDMLMAAATTEENTSRALSQVSAILRQRHKIPADGESDFSVNTQAELREAQKGISNVLSMLLLAVAAVSLLVGGIGVMNIMLVSVAERTREIGIRMSIGARESDILIQFLIEAIVLSIVGGVFGISVGVAGTFGIGFALGWSTVPTVNSIAVAVLTSAAIGVVFGFLPARRAAKLDPIDALRTD